MLGHQDVGVDGKRVRLAGSLDDAFQGGLGFGGFEEGETAVTAEGDEVELACVVSPLEAYGHGLDFSRCGGRTVRASLECPLMSR